MTAEPGDLYELHLEVPQLDELNEPVLVHALDGYVDAGSGVSLAVAHLLEKLPHTVIATFDVDQLLDYRSRRPTLTFSRNAFTDYETPQLVIHHVTDEAGVPFLLLTGPEPDVLWERFVSAVGQIVDRFAVRLTVGLMAIPMAVPHTRPTGMSVHATRSDLLPPDQQDWVGTVQVPGHATGLLEFRFGQEGRDAIGFAAHVPHYVARSEFPETARQLIQALSDTSGLLLPTAGLDEEAAKVQLQLAEQLRDNPEVAQVVEALEQQYDTFVSATGRGLLARSAPLPTADELGAQFEAFLAERDTRG
ncbi:PAC2 family protein [Nakamurella sp. YIM 132087]|uniref:PAC2 family protein n=1 Tax=Nakamurella alba TaxID=2665158 RepID=A0A7K1FPS3_9ACTN|nr:PAC2 family protein [Nakamurella alba]MTD16146.1 PAC2 family protein [Nakamurella alba]